MDTESKKSPRILILADSGHKMGLTIHHPLLSLARGLERRGFKVTFAGFYESSQLGYTGVYNNRLYWALFKELRFILGSRFGRPLVLFNSHQSSQLMKIVKASNVDVIINPRVFNPLADVCKRSSTKLVLWDAEGFAINHDGAWIDIAKNADMVLTYSLGAVPLTKELVGHDRVAWFPYGFDPTIFHKSNLRKTLDISFAGYYSIYKKRIFAELLEPILSKYGRRVHLFGSNFPTGYPYNQATRHREVPFYSMNDIFNASKICLNFHADYQRDYELTLNSRTFEILGSGSLELIDPVPGLDRMFSPKEDLMLMEDGKAALEICASVLQDEYRREKVETCGNRRALTQHTIDDRVSQIVPLLEKLV